MTNETQTKTTDQTSDFERCAAESRNSLPNEMFGFLMHTKKWWLTPIIVMLLFMGLLIIVGGSAAAPFIYTLF